MVPSVTDGAAVDEWRRPRLPDLRVEEPRRAHRIPPAQRSISLTVPEADRDPTFVDVAEPVSDQVEMALHNAQALLDAALRMNQSRRASAAVRSIGEDEAMRTAAGALLRGARREVFIVTPGRALCPEDKLAASTQLLAALRSHGVKVGLLGTPSTVADPRGRAHLIQLDRIGVNVRIARHNLQEMIMVDREVALLRARTAPGHHQRLIVRTAAVVHSFCGFLSATWAATVPLEAYTRYEDPDQVAEVAQIIESLGMGYKDDVAARKLGLSVRTYRRRVAEIMELLNATSRFQAGVRAVELGLVEHSRRQSA